MSERQRAMVATELANMTLGSNQWESKSGHPAPVTQPEAAAPKPAPPPCLAPPPCQSAPCHRRAPARHPAEHIGHGWHLGHTASAASLKRGWIPSIQPTAGTLDTPQALRGLQAVMQGQPAPARRGTAGAAPTDPAGWPWPPSKKVLQIPLHFFLATKKASSKTGLTC